MHTAKNLWPVILRQLGEYISSTAINTWFDEIEVVSLDSSTLTLYCLDQLKRQSIITYHMTALEQTVRDLFSADISVAFLDDLAYQKLTKADNSSCFLSNISDAYRFENYIVGDSNRMAFAAANAIAEKFVSYSNPLVLYSKPGLGKTHLLHAIANKVIETNPSTRIVYLKGDTFVNELIQAIRDGSNQEFRDKYRTADVFLMDDIQFLSGKKQTQIEFFNTFEALIDTNCRIVLTMDRHPSELVQLDERIRNRFEGGLIVPIAEPEFVTRLNIVKSKATQRDLAVSEQDATYIAEHITGNVRRLEGILNRIKATLSLDSSRNISKMVESIVDCALDEVPAAYSPEQILKDVAKHFHISAEEIKSKSRQRNVTTARQVAMYVMATRYDFTVTKIGTFFARDHSTVNHAIKTVQKAIDTDVAFKQQVKKFLKE